MVLALRARQYHDSPRRVVVNWLECGIIIRHAFVVRKSQRHDLLRRILRIVSNQKLRSVTARTVRALIVGTDVIQRESEFEIMFDLKITPVRAKHRQVHAIDSNRSRTERDVGFVQKQTQPWVVSPPLKILDFRLEHDAAKLVRWLDLVRRIHDKILHVEYVMQRGILQIHNITVALSIRVSLWDASAANRLVRTRPTNRKAGPDNRRVGVRLRTCLDGGWRHLIDSGHDDVLLLHVLGERRE